MGSFGVDGFVVVTGGLGGLVGGLVVVTLGGIYGLVDSEGLGGSGGLEAVVEVVAEVRVVPDAVVVVVPSSVVSSEGSVAEVLSMVAAVGSVVDSLVDVVAPSAVDVTGLTGGLRQAVSRHSTNVNDNRTDVSFFMLFQLLFKIKYDRIANPNTRGRFSCVVSIEVISKNWNNTIEPSLCVPVRRKIDRKDTRLLVGNWYNTLLLQPMANAAITKELYYKGPKRFHSAVSSLLSVIIPFSRIVSLKIH